MKQQMDQMGEALGAAGEHVDKLEMEQGNKSGEIEIKRIEANTKAYDAITKRLQAIGTLLSQAELQQLASETKREAMEQPDPGQPASESMGIPEQMPEEALERPMEQQEPQAEYAEPPGMSEPQPEQPPTDGGFFTPEPGQP
jgi:hypothetical protein